jgi:hypothetical protein
MLTPMKPNQPTLPTLTDWREPQTVRGCDLVTVLAQARAAGFWAHRMKVLPEVIYELQFWKLPAAETGKHLREPPKTEARARTYGSPDSLQIPNKTFNLHENQR